MVDRVAGHGGPSAHRFGPHVLRLVDGADRVGRMQVVPAVLAAQEDELSPLAPLPEVAIAVGQLGQHDHGCARFTHVDLLSPSGAAPVRPPGSLAPVLRGCHSRRAPPRRPDLTKGPWYLEKAVRLMAQAPGRGS